MRYADEMGLDLAAFDTCTSSADYDAVLAADKRLGRNDFEVSGTPTFFINNLRVVGAQPLDTFVGMIEDALSRAP